MNNNLKKIRQKKRLSARALGNLAGVSDYCILSAEKGSNPSLETVIAIAKALNVQVADIWDIEIK